MESLPKLCVLTRAVGVSTDVDDMAVVQDAVDEGGWLDLGMRSWRNDSWHRFSSVVL